VAARRVVDLPDIHADDASTQGQIHAKRRRIVAVDAKTSSLSVKHVVAPLAMTVGDHQKRPACRFDNMPIVRRRASADVDDRPAAAPHDMIAPMTQYPLPLATARRIVPALFAWWRA
jgi:hypothetical protein